MDVIRPAEGPTIEVCRRLSLFLSPKGHSVSQGSRTCRACLSLLCAPGPLLGPNRHLCKPSPPATLCEAFWGSALRLHSDTWCHAYISAPHTHTHTEFAGELPLHQPAGPIHRTEEREIWNSVMKQGFLSMCTDVALHLHSLTVNPIKRFNNNKACLCESFLFKMT